MSEIKWIKLSTSMFDDEKIRLIEQMPDADTILVIWVKLLAQAGKTNASGYIFLNENIPYTDEMLATIFNRPLNTVRMALNVFKQFGMIEVDENEFISVANWEKHQNIEGMERVKKLNAERNKRYRERKKQELLENNTSDVSVTSRDGTDIDKELDIDKEEDKDIPSSNSVTEIYNHYLSKNIVQHGKITSAMRTAINARLKDYSKEQIIQVIDNYAIVYHSDDYWFTTKYTLTDLMRDKDVRKFIDDAEPLKNFSNSKGVKTSAVDKSSNQSSYKQDYSKYDFTKKGNVSWLPEDLRD